MTTQWHTPDFLVIRQAGAGFEEWKPATALDPLSVTQPYRYQRKPTGGWQCPPGETAAQALGLYYRVRTSAEYDPTSIGNLKFLQDFWIRPYPVTDEQAAQVLSSLDTYPGVSVAAPLEAHPDLPVDVVWALLLQQQVFTDLTVASLMQWDRVSLYRHAEEVLSPSERHAHPQATPLASRLLWDGRLWEAEVQGDTIVLRPEIGAEFRLSAVYFHRLVEQGVITPGGLAWCAAVWW